MRDANYVNLNRDGDTHHAGDAEKFLWRTALIFEHCQSNHNASHNTMSTQLDNQTTSEPPDSAACSPAFSDTPETDATPSCAVLLGVLARKLEREKNQAQAIWRGAHKDLEFLSRVLHRVTMEKYAAIGIAKRLSESGDPKPWKIDEWRKAQSDLLENAERMHHHENQKS